MPCCYYIYYRVDPAKTVVGERRIHGLIEAMHRSTGVAGRMLKKRDEPNLWMEIYEGVVDEAKFEWELAEAVDHLKIDEVLLPGTPRHIECFKEQ